VLEGVRLYEGKGKGGGVDWAGVVKHMGGGRSVKQCRLRWSNVLQHRGQGFKEGSFTPSEVWFIYVCVYVFTYECEYACVYVCKQLIICDIIFIHACGSECVIARTSLFLFVHM
jgi:hypothetical protein